MNSEQYINESGIKCFGISNNLSTRLRCSVDEYDILNNELSNCSAQELIDLEFK